MISRIWHGWTTFDNAEKYEALLTEDIFVGIQNRHMRGFKNIQLLRREAGREVEFVTIMLFDSLEAVREFAGEDYEAAVVPEKARAILSHFDDRSQHYEYRNGANWREINRIVLMASCGCPTPALPNPQSPRERGTGKRGQANALKKPHVCLPAQVLVGHTCTCGTGAGSAGRTGGTGRQAANLWKNAKGRQQLRRWRFIPPACLPICS